MTRCTLRGLGLGLFGLGCLFAASPVEAGSLPTKIDCDVRFNFNVQYGPQAMIPRAPWYTYFPVDPNVLARQPGTSPYPPWPATFPPQAPPSLPPAPLPAPRPVGPMTWAPAGSSVQPVGYMPGQAPSYWYGR